MEPSMASGHGSTGIDNRLKFRWTGFES